MGKTPINQRLFFIVDGRWKSHPKILELEDKGHTVVFMEDLLPDVDISAIFHPAAHAWTDEMWDTTLLDAAMKRARKRKKEAK